MAYRRDTLRGDWPALGKFASAILGVGLVVLGLAIGIGGGDVPDGWVVTEAEVVEDPTARIRTRRALLGVTARYVQFEQADGQVVQHRCEYCWGGIGDPLTIAFDPGQPTNLRHLHFHRIAATVLVVTGLAFLGVGVWWSSRRSARSAAGAPTDAPGSRDRPWD